MLTVALATLRTRWTVFAGSFVALSLGVALLTAMGLALASTGDAPERQPQRFAAAPVVVRGADTLRVPTPAGVRVQRLVHPRAVPARTFAALRRLGTVVEDRSFAVRVPGGPGGLVGHPWSTAAFAPYRLSSGRAPRASDEVVATGDWTGPGRRIRTDRGTVRVVGTVAARGFENALFYTDERAARLSPVSVQLVVDADAAAVRTAVRGSDGVQVLTGRARSDADADPGRDGEALTAMNAMFGTAGGISAFVSVFVVASTFAFAVAQRRREFGLLRVAGATPGQIRRTVLIEALVVGVLASVAGCAAGRYGAPQLAARAVHGSLAPRWFTVGDHIWPYHLAFWTGLLVALCGAAASRRAGRTGPAQALGEASTDTGTTARGRRAAGLALLLTAAVTLGWALATDPGDLLHRKSYVTRPMLLISAVAVLAPTVVRPLTRLLGRLPALLPGAAGLLVRETAAASVRRTAAVAAPVLVTVALTGSLLGATATLDRARAAEALRQTAADFVVTPAAGAGFDAATLRRLHRVPGTVVCPVSTGTVHVLEDGVALIASEAHAAAPGPLAATSRLPLTAGRTTDLDDDSVIVNEEWQRHTVGQRVDVWLGDGSRRTLRIAAVMATGTGDNGVYVTPRNAPGAAVERVDVAVSPGADRASVASGLREAVPPSGGRVRTGEEWVAARHPANDGTTRLGFLLVLGLALLYTGISLANTMVMATADRVRELAVLRLTGATTAQVLRLVGAEALLVVAVGGVLGLLVAVLDLAGISGALALLSAGSAMVVPWAAVGAALGACAVLAVCASVVPAAFALRRGAAQPAGVRRR
ncbi:ABC transporter permease [Streptacidiphilus griseoplanus]|uniref:ABC transporter permease n=1 Tax=Peterkaempfera griseoplana TaxID=66896 RepID=UPI0006E2DFF5|nr:FtsX-like permease family protein [Peterkaempfera griseoplana]